MESERRTSAWRNTDGDVPIWAVVVVVGTVVAGAFELLRPRTIVEPGTSQRDIATNQVRRIGKSAERFCAAIGRPPTSLAELERFDTDEVVAAQFSVLDAWGNPVSYRVLDAGRFELKSFGADGVLGGEDENADIVWGAAPAGR